MRWARTIFLETQGYIEESESLKKIRIFLGERKGNQLLAKQIWFYVAGWLYTLEFFF